MKSLESQINTADKADEDKNRDPVREYTSKYEAFLGMLNKILSSENIEQKSRLIFENVRGMVLAQAFQVAVKRGVVFQQIDPESSPQRFVVPIDYLKKKGLLNQAQLDVSAREGLASLQSLCNELIVRVVSIEGKGRDEMIEMVRAMNLMIQEHEHQDSMAKDLVMGGRGFR
jgi:hypothetical protein